MAGSRGQGTPVGRVRVCAYGQVGGHDSRRDEAGLRQPPAQLSPVLRHVIGRLLSWSRQAAARAGPASRPFGPSCSGPGRRARTRRRGRAGHRARHRTAHGRDAPASLQKQRCREVRVSERQGPGRRHQLHLLPQGVSPGQPGELSDRVHLVVGGDELDVVAAEPLKIPAAGSHLPVRVTAALTGTPAGRPGWLTCWRARRPRCQAAGAG